MVTLTAVLLAAAVTAAPTEAQEVAIGANASMTVPKEWRAKSFPMPVRGSTNLRIEIEGLKMAVTGIPVPKSKEKEGWVNPLLRDVPPEKKLEFDVMNASMQYAMRGGKQYGADESVSFKGEGYNGAVMTLTSPSQEAIFEVFPGSMYRCVTTSIVKAEKMTYVISVGSDACDGEKHGAALAAIKSIKLLGG